jgi:hypothetical protein
MFDHPSRFISLAAVTARFAPLVSEPKISFAVSRCQEHPVILTSRVALKGCGVTIYNQAVECLFGLPAPPNGNAGRSFAWGTRGHKAPVTQLIPFNAVWRGRISFIWLRWSDGLLAG